MMTKSTNVCSRDKNSTFSDSFSEIWDYNFQMLISCISNNIVDRNRLSWVAFQQ